jgi:phospholipase C
MKYATLFLAGAIAGSSIPANAASHRKNPPADFKHIVIIYEENYSHANAAGRHAL